MSIINNTAQNFEKHLIRGEAPVPCNNIKANCTSAIYIINFVLDNYRIILRGIYIYIPDLCPISAAYKKAYVA